MVYGEEEATLSKQSWKRERLGDAFDAVDDNTKQKQSFACTYTVLSLI